LIQPVIASLLEFRSGSLGCAPTVVTKCSIAAFTGSGGPYFSSVSAYLRASSVFDATIRLSLAKEMSRQVDWSSGAACADDEGGVVGCDEAAVVDVDVDAWLDVELDVVLPLEQPAVMTAVVIIPAIAIRFSRTRYSLPEDPFAAGTIPTISLRRLLDIAELHVWTF
jgi:hypothetical protein